MELFELRFIFILFFPDIGSPISETFAPAFSVDYLLKFLSICSAISAYL